MKKSILVFCTLFLFSTSAQAYTVTCTNCSQMFTQLLDSITSSSQLASLVKQEAESMKQTIEQIQQTKEAIEQTIQQIKMVENMVQNTLQLPETLRNELTQYLTDLGTQTAQLNTQRGEINALAQVYNAVFPEESEFTAGLTASDQAGIEAANQKYQEHYDKWSKSIDEASQATFQLSGAQLQELSNSGQLDSYINNLLNTPEGQMQAIQAGNQLAAVQINEARQFRALVATSTQSGLMSQMKAEKKDQANREWWEKTTNTEGLRDGIEVLSEELVPFQ